MSQFSCPHEPYDDITLHGVRPPSHPLRYPTDGESIFDIRLTPTYSVECDPSELTYPTFSMGSYYSKPSHLSDLFDFRFFCFICWPSSTPSSQSWVHSHLHCALRVWLCPQRKMWGFWEWIPSVWWLTWIAHVKLIMRIALFVGSCRVIIFFYGIHGR